MNAFARKISVGEEYWFAFGGHCTSDISGKVIEIVDIGDNDALVTVNYFDTNYIQCDDSSAQRVTFRLSSLIMLREVV